MIKCGDFLVPWTSFGPWQSHLGRPSAPSLPKVAIFDDIWGRSEVTLELMLGTAGLFFDACRLQEPNMEGSSWHSESETVFSSISGSAPRCSGAFSLQRELCFHLDDQWQRMLTFGSMLESFSEPKAQLYSRWGLPESISGGRAGVSFYR